MLDGDALFTTTQFPCLSQLVEGAPGGWEGTENRPRHPPQLSNSERFRLQVEQLDALRLAEDWKSLSQRDPR